MDKLSILKEEMKTSPLFCYDYYTTPFQIWSAILSRIEELEEE